MKEVAIIRPEPAASETQSRAAELGLSAIVCPLFETEALAWKAPANGEFDGLLLTSANAPRLAGPEIAGLRLIPAFCVGAATARAAREQGLVIAAIGSGGVDDLLQQVPTDRRLLHLCGEDRIAPSSPHHIIPVLVYRSKPTEPPDPSVLNGTITLVHSPRAGRRLTDLAERGSVNPATIVCAAISPAGAEAVGTGWRHVAIAGQPSDEALLALAAKLCKSETGQ